MSALPPPPPASPPLNLLTEVRIDSTNLDTLLDIFPLGSTLVKVGIANTLVREILAHCSATERSLFPLLKRILGEGPFDILKEEAFTRFRESHSQARDKFDREGDYRYDWLSYATGVFQAAAEFQERHLNGNVSTSKPSLVAYLSSKLSEGENAARKHVLRTTTKDIGLGESSHVEYAEVACQHAAV